MLTAIVPVSGMAGRLHNLENWLSTIHDLDIEVVIVHDYRDSETEKQLLSILELQNSRRIVFLSGTYGSPGAARNAGLDRATSKFICFWDSDDLPLPQSTVSDLEIYSEDCDVLVGQYVQCSNHPENLKQFKSIDSSLQDIAMNPGLWRMVFRRDFLSSVRFQKMRMGEDQLFLAEVIARKPRLTFSNTVFYNYFVGHSSQLTLRKDAIIELIDAFREISSLRKVTSGREFEFSSIVILRMNFTLMKFALRNNTKLVIFKSLMSSKNLITHHPLLQVKCALLVIYRVYRASSHA